VQDIRDTLHGTFHVGCIADISLDDGERRIGGNIGQVLPAAGEEIIKNPHTGSVCKKAANKMRADKTGASRYEKVTGHLSPHSHVFETQLAHLVRLVDVAQIGDPGF
jgi:hypothetical protein